VYQLNILRNSPKSLSPIWLLALSGLVFIVSGPVLSADDTEPGLDWWTMSMTLLGGLALFLFGMEQMAESLKAVAGDSMKRVLGALTKSRIMGLLTGAFVTAVIQSSSVTTVMLVGFVTAGLMSLSQAIGVILGADIGTTITAQIVAFKVTKYALVLITVGFLMIFTGKQERTKQYGKLVMGLGLIFFGMGMMSDAMRPLRTYDPFIELMQNVSNPLIGILVATLFTGLIQSSSATMGVVIALALQGLISLEAGIALALGANIGTCVTAGLAAIGKPREAVRVAVAHVTFKIVGVLLIVWFIPSFADLVRQISPVADPGVTGLDKLAEETPRQIANAHTLFNVGIAFLFLPFSSLFARFCEWIVPDAPIKETYAIVSTRFLDDALITTPALALDRARMEINHLGEYVQEMVDSSLPAFLSGNKNELNEVAKIDDKVDLLHVQIIRFLGKVSKQSLSQVQSEHLSNLFDAANNMESIGDIIETDIVKLAEDMVKNEFTISDETQSVLSDLHQSVSQAVKLVLSAIENNDERAAQTVIAMKGEINMKTETAAQHQAQRLIADAPKRLEAYAIEVEYIEKLKRIYYFTKRIAKLIVPQDLVMRDA
jgi:phosphate:Na+ symporter